MIQFDEATHTYTRNNTKYTSVTTLLKDYGLSADYTNIPKEVLAKAAIRGKETHKELEDYIKQGVVSQSLDVQNFIKYVTARGIDLSNALSEELVYDDTYLIAGTIDFQYKDGDEEIIADFKTTSSIHWEAVAWQLSIYNYIKVQGDVLAYYMKHLKVFHLYNGKLTVREVPIIDYDEVVNLLIANITKTPYTYKPDLTKIITKSEATVLSTLLDEIAQCESLLNDLLKKKEEMQKKIEVNMANNNQRSITVEDINITYIDSASRKSLDTQKVKDLCTLLNMDINTLYKTTQTKPRLNITRRKN